MRRQRVAAERLQIFIGITVALALEIVGLCQFCPLNFILEIGKMLKKKKKPTVDFSDIEDFINGYARMECSKYGKQPFIRRLI